MSSRFLTLMRAEWPPWLAWKIYDTLFTVFIVLTLKHASKKTRNLLSTWYAFLGWESDGQDKVLEDQET